jgi:putative FmdB family regulatory protein
VKGPLKAIIPYEGLPAMPTYEYHCDACEHHFDEFQSITEKPLKKCPQCGKPKLRRIFGTGGAILFKGSGFYQTDYRSESYKAGAKAEAAKTKPPAEKGSSNGTAATSGKAASTQSTKASDKSSKSE